VNREGFYAADKLLRRDLTGSHRIRFSPLRQTSILRKMAEKSYYVEFAFTSKQTHIRWQAVVEVPNVLVRRNHAELINNGRREKSVALDLGREVALAAFSGANNFVGPCHEDALWYDDRHPVMDERVCDHEQNGIKVWRIS
jgi:hypothetical protein